MHWTAFLAYRRFPAYARVMEDCACIQCGYNLRMQMVSSRCPECGYEVGNSVFLLARPSVTARGLRTAGATYLVPLCIVIPMLFSAYWAIFIVALAGACAAAFRFISVSDLRFNASLARLPVIGPRLTLWWLITIADVVVGGAWMTAMIVVSKSLYLQNSGLGWRLVIWGLIAWWFTTMLSAVAAGRFGFALMDMLNYVWTRIGFRVQQVAATTVLVAGPFFAIGFLTVTSRAMVIILEIALLLLTGFAILATAVPLLQAATACEESAEDWDDLIESERIVVVPESQRPRQPEPPPIKVEGG